MFAMESLIAGGWVDSSTRKGPWLNSYHRNFSLELVGVATVPERVFMVVTTRDNTAYDGEVD